MRSLITGALIMVGSVADAAAPQVPTEAPYIVLSDNLDEPNGYGFCIDTLGRGQSDLLQSHTCKPAREGNPRNAQDNDTRFTFDPETGQVVSYAFEGVCMQALIAGELTMFGLLECSDHPRQQFVYNSADQTLRLGKDQSLCVSVAPETAPAGPWVKRALMLENCDETNNLLKKWTIVAE